MINSDKQKTLKSEDKGLLLWRATSKYSYYTESYTKKQVFNKKKCHLMIEEYCWDK